mgnify:CR=1 FL=1
MTRTFPHLGRRLREPVKNLVIPPGKLMVFLPSALRISGARTDGSWALARFILATSPKPVFTGPGAVICTSTPEPFHSTASHSPRVCI